MFRETKGLIGLESKDVNPCPDKLVIVIQFVKALKGGSDLGIFNNRLRIVNLRIEIQDFCFEVN